LPRASLPTGKMLKRRTPPRRAGGTASELGLDERTSAGIDSKGVGEIHAFGALGKDLVSTRRNEEQIKQGSLKTLGWWGTEVSFRH